MNTTKYLELKFRALCEEMGMLSSVNRDLGEDLFIRNGGYKRANKTIKKMIILLRVLDYHRKREFKKLEEMLRG